MTTMTQIDPRNPPKLAYRVKRGKHIQNEPDGNGGVKEVQYRTGGEFESNSPICFADTDKFERLDLRNSIAPEVILRDETEKLEEETTEQYAARLKKVIEKAQAALANPASTPVSTVQTTYTHETLTKLNVSELKVIAGNLGFDVTKVGNDKAKMVQIILGK